MNQCVWSGRKCRDSDHNRGIEDSPFFFNLHSVGVCAVLDTHTYWSPAVNKLIDLGFFPPSIQLHLILRDTQYLIKVCIPHIFPSSCSLSYQEMKSGS